MSHRKHFAASHRVFCPATGVGQKQRMRSAPVCLLLPGTDIMPGTRASPRRALGSCYWITSSAVANSVSGMVRPRALAVVRLMTRSISRRAEIFFPSGSRWTVFLTGERCSERCQHK
jgi:hypothetical protein